MQWLQWQIKKTAAVRALNCSRKERPVFFSLIVEDWNNYLKLSEEILPRML
jgi:hypothetical protein